MGFTWRHGTPTQLQGATAGVLLHLRRRCWWALLSVCLDVAENTGWHQASPHSVPCCTHSRSVLGGTLSILGIVTLGNLRSYTSGMFEEGVPSLWWTLHPEDWPWLSLPGRPEPFALSSSRTLTRQESSFQFSAQLLASTVALCIQTTSVTQLCHWPTPLMTHYCPFETCFESPQRRP